MSIEKLNEGFGFIPARVVLYNRLAELAEIEVKTEAERYEEEIKSRQFWEWGRVENSLLSLSYRHIESKNATPIQNRIYNMARENRLQNFGGTL